MAEKTTTKVEDVVVEETTEVVEKKENFLSKAGAVVKKNWKTVTAVTVGTVAGLAAGAKIGASQALKSISVADITGDIIDVVAEEVTENI